METFVDGRIFLSSEYVVQDKYMIVDFDRYFCKPKTIDDYMAPGSFQNQCSSCFGTGLHKSVIQLTHDFYYLLSEKKIKLTSDELIYLYELTGNSYDKSINPMSLNDEIKKPEDWSKVVDKSTVNLLVEDNPLVKLATRRFLHENKKLNNGLCPSCKGKISEGVRIVFVDMKSHKISEVYCQFSVSESMAIPGMLKSLFKRGIKNYTAHIKSLKSL